MQFENPQIPEQINYSDEHPLKEFLWLLFAVGVSLATLLLALHLCAKLLAPFIPFSYEQKIAQSVINKLNEDEEPEEQSDIQCYLQNLADEIVLSADLPEDMSITVHYSEDETMNAFATIGGHIIIFEGLLHEIETENALVMLLAHEIAHIKHRDPIVSLSRGVISAMAIGLLSSSSDNAAVSNYLGSAGLITQLSFSRSQEENADELALGVVRERFGHWNGAETLFEKLQDAYEDVEPPAFMSSHPPTQARIDRIVSLSNREGELTELPDMSCSPDINAGTASN